MDLLCQKYHLSGNYLLDLLHQFWHLEYFPAPLDESIFREFLDHICQIVLRGVGKVSKRLQMIKEVWVQDTWTMYYLNIGR